MSVFIGSIPVGEYAMTIADETRKKIRAALVERGWDQKQLAFAMKRTEAWASKLLNTKKGISLDLLKEIADVLNVKVVSLLPESICDKDASRVSIEEYIDAIVERKLAEKVKR